MEPIVPTEPIVFTLFIVPIEPVEFIVPEEPIVSEEL